MAPISPRNPILIIGAGITGLTLAHSLTKDRIPFLLFERDDNLESRGPGWAISIHWARPALQYCLAPSVYSKVENAQVCPGTNDIGRFLFLDLSNAKPRFEIPAAPLLRLSRARFREVLAEGVEVKWSMKMEGWKEMEDGGVEVEFEGGEKVKGAMLVGADGAGSKVRRLLCPESGALEQLPIRMLGTTWRLSAEEFQPLKEIHPMLFQGCHPVTGTFMWFSIISVPETNGSLGTGVEFFKGQLNLSWRFKDGGEEVPTSNEGRLAMMKRLGQPFEKRLRALIENLPADTIVTEIKLQDWSAVKWPNHGRVTIIGDAAHPMTMYRGEALNHGVVDAQMLHDTILSIHGGEVSQPAALSDFDKQVAARTKPGVLLSREACLDAHDLGALKHDSPLVSRRALVRTPAMIFPKEG